MEERAAAWNSGMEQRAAAWSSGMEQPPTRRLASNAVADVIDLQVKRQPLCVVVDDGPANADGQ